MRQRVPRKRTRISTPQVGVFFCLSHKNHGYKQLGRRSQNPRFRCQNLWVSTWHLPNAKPESGAQNKNQRLLTAYCGLSALPLVLIYIPMLLTTSHSIQFKLSLFLLVLLVLLLLCAFEFNGLSCSSRLWAPPPRRRQLARRRLLPLDAQILCRLRSSARGEQRAGRGGETSAAEVQWEEGGCRCGWGPNGCKVLCGWLYLALKCLVRLEFGWMRVYKSLWRFLFLRFFIFISDLTSQ